MENEELDEIDYYEIVSLEEISKFNPTFVAFSNEEILNNLLQFFKSDKIKATTFLSLFTEIIQRQINPTQTKNLIVVADAKRGNFAEIEDDDSNSKNGFIISDFIAKIKSNNKEQIKLAYKNKNKLWFPIVYDDESSGAKFRPTTTTIIELNDSTDNKFILFNDDERDIPIMGVYFYEPSSQNNDNLNEKIVSYLTTDREKGEVKLMGDYASFDELIADYKIRLPLNKIDEDDYNYTSLNNLLKKYNYDLDYINIDDFEIIKEHLKSLNKNEKEEKIKYVRVPHKPIHLDNNRFNFYYILKETFKLLDITLKSSKKLQKDLEEIKGEKVYIEELPIHRDLSILIANINNDNYSDIIKNLREIRKNFSITNCVSILETYLKINIDEIKRHFDKLENKFKYLMGFYKDLFEINFTFAKEEHEFKLANDMSNYEGITTMKLEKKMVDTEETKDSSKYDELVEEEEDLNKYYNNYYYKLEKGFVEALEIVLPFLVKLKQRSYLPIKLDFICNHLFNIHRGVPQKYSIIRNKYKDKYDENHCKEESLKSIKYVMTSEDVDVKLKEANVEYVQIINEMIYDAICKWSIEVQRELLDGTLLYFKDIYYVPCIDLWNEYGAPYNMEVKDGILPYLICIFENTFKEEFSENDDNYLPLEKGFKEKIIEKMKNDYNEDLKQFQTEGAKKIKENKGFEAQKKLVAFLQDKEKKYDMDKFFETFIESLIYYPSVKFKKIHKYLMGCCLEKIDTDFTNDRFFKTDRKDLEKAKSKFTGDRVLNKARYLRFYFSKLPKTAKKEFLKGIDFESLLFPIYEISLDEWFDELDDSTILSKSNIEDIRTKLVNSYKFHVNDLLPVFNIKKEIEFKNYRQILLGISKILFEYSKTKANGIIKKINKTIEVLDRLNSIINEDNETDINQIQTIIVIRALCLPSFPDMKKPINLKISVSSDIDNYSSIFSDIKTKILKIIENSKMPNIEEQKDYINKMREENKNKILSTFKTKSIEENAVIKELKKIGLDPNKETDEDDDVVNVNKKKTDNDLDEEAEDEYNVREEDGTENDEDLESDDMGFIYAK